MVDIPFLKKITLPKLSFEFLKAKPGRVAGIDIGSYSTKVVQLRYEGERAILETYGELLNENYFSRGEAGGGSGFLRYLDQDITALLKDLLREAEVSTKEAVLGIPAGASFSTIASFPKVSRSEINQAIPYEARKYVPIPISEVTLDWDILESAQERNVTEVLIIAVPKEVIEKFKRVAELAGIHARALELETASVTRALAGRDPTPLAIINFGHLSTTITVADRGRLRASHSFGRGSQELTRALERGLGVARNRAETLKRDTGLSRKLEERDITSILEPLIETVWEESERFMNIYNRKAERKIQKVVLTGGGSNLQGLVEHAATKFGLEVSRGNPFARIVTPAFFQPILNQVGPSLSVAAGLALREITIR